MQTLQLNSIDYLAFFGFLALLSVVGYIAGRGETASSNDYFLAGNRLPWYVVGGSLVASVLSTEHFSGNGRLGGGLRRQHRHVDLGAGRRHHDAGVPVGAVLAGVEGRHHSPVPGTSL